MSNCSATGEGWRKNQWDLVQSVQLNFRFNPWRITNSLPLWQTFKIDLTKSYTNSMIENSKLSLTGLHQLIILLSQQNDFIARRQEGTGEWLIETDEFQQWENNKRRILFCPGIPGSGKTMMVSIVVDHLFKKFRDDHSIGIAFLYCDFRLQFPQRHTLLPECVTGLYKVRLLTVFFPGSLRSYSASRRKLALASLQHHGQYWVYQKIWKERAQHPWGPRQGWGYAKISRWPYKPNIKICEGSPRDWGENKVSNNY